MKRMLFLFLFLLAQQATAGVTYQLIGGLCTDSHREEVLYPDPQVPGDFIFGPGQPVCSRHITATITMKDGYVPGTFFHNRDLIGEDLIVESASVSDGRYTLTTTFPIRETGLPISGTLPVRLAPTLLENFFDEGWAFVTKPDGTWQFWVEFGALACGIGSIAGPANGGGYCTDPRSSGYTSIGTYVGWQRVPEPSGLAFLALALVGLRRRHR